MAVDRTPKLVTADGEVVTLAGVHPLAEMAPMLPEAELRELAESIGAVGLLNPVIVDRDGLLIDGRNRLAACDLAGVDARCVIHDGDAAEVVLAAEDRRHLTPGARAAWRAKVMAAAGYRVNGRWKYGRAEFPESGKLKTERNELSRAGLILDYLPHLLDEIIAGNVALDDAHRQAKAERSKREQIASLDDDLAALVEHGSLDLDEALARQLLPDDLRQRVNAGHVTVDEARQLDRERDDRISSMVTALVGLIDARRTVANFEARVDAGRYSPEYPRALAMLGDDDRKTISKEFPHVT